ncbi:hypothetical protein B0H13DRAFT_2305498 [Mycena leptocephala]|nr:hypothetical protein B0H13DRAFT_2305498 [Mycena leptocephala]
MASMYLLGNPDHYASHKYVPFAWRQYVQFVRNFWVESMKQEEEDEEEDRPDEEQSGYYKAALARLKEDDEDYSNQEDRLEDEPDDEEYYNHTEEEVKPSTVMHNDEESDWESDDKDDIILEKDARNKKANRPVQHPFMPNHPLFLAFCNLRFCEALHSHIQFYRRLYSTVI